MSLWREYAIEPSLFDDYNQARLLLEFFGIERGRLIGGFPRKWQREVKRRLSAYTDMQRKSLLNKLSKLNAIVVPRTCPYDGGIAWRPQAFECDRVEPFHAIITNGPDPHPKAIDGTTDLDVSPLWSVFQLTSVPRNALALGRALDFLLAHCHAIMIIDREFMPSGGTGKKWLKPLAVISAALLPAERITRFELHALDKPLDPWPDGKFVKDCLQDLPPCIPKGISLIANLWRQKAQGVQFHRRMILTDIGGVILDPGFDEGKDGETYDFVSLLGSSECDKLFSLFDKGSPTYDLVDTTVVRGMI